VEELAVVVNDAEAVYPVRIDPTFSDANWVSMGGFPGANGQVYAAVTDGSGNLYIGGDFTVVGNTIANYIAQWNGSSWSALGSGMNGGPCVCAGGVGQHVVCGRRFHDGGRQRGQLHRAMEREQLVGPRFGDEGGYDGPDVSALAVSGSTLYAGGDFTTAGGSAANYIAQWNGSSWSALGSGMNGRPPMCMRWRCRAARCMRAAISRRRAAARPITSRNGTGAVGRPSVRG
jgi:hypothetical protein